MSEREALVQKLKEFRLDSVCTVRLSSSLNVTYTGDHIPYHKRKLTRARTLTYR